MPCAWLLQARLLRASCCWRRVALPAIGTCLLRSPRPCPAPCMCRWRPAWYATRLGQPGMVAGCRPLWKGAAPVEFKEGAPGRRGAPPCRTAGGKRACAVAAAADSHPSAHWQPCHPHARPCPPTCPSTRALLIWFSLCLRHSPAPAGCKPRCFSPCLPRMPAMPCQHA